jgi:uncharacterized integral membrane protein (TIGR00698 family)
MAATDNPVTSSPDSPAPHGAGQDLIRKMLFAVLIAAVLKPSWGEGAITRFQITPPIALTVGIVVALLGLVGFAKQTRRWAKLLIQVGVVLLGFRMDLHEVVKAGTVGLLFAVGTIALTFALGAALGRWLAIDRKVTTLVSSGTAICGGSAIAAVGSVIAASEAQIAVAMGCVFILNSIALYVFPPLGEALKLSAEQFGTWAAVAIHDISSVVGAADTFDHLMKGTRERGDAHGPTALETATAVKLSRTLWIVPIALVMGWWHRREDGRGEPGEQRTAQIGRSAARPPIPWFIGLFLAASVARSLMPAVAEAAPTIEIVAKRVLTVALLLIGMGMSRKAIASVGWRALVLAVVLWVTISVVALVVVWRVVG